MNAKQTKISKKQIIYLHTVMQINNIEEQEYRNLLLEAAGVHSSVEMRRDDFDRLLNLMQSKGFYVGRKRRIKSEYPERKGMATPGQLKYLDDLASQVFGTSDAKAYYRWLEHYFRVSHPRFLRANKACSAIEGLKSMAKRKQGDGK